MFSLSDSQLPEIITSYVLILESSTKASIETLALSERSFLVLSDMSVLSVNAY